MKYIYKTFLITAIFFSYFSIFSQITPDNTELLDRLKSYEKYLASDSLEGRFPGTAGGYAAENYISNFFKEFGLKSFTNDYKQEFFVTTGKKYGDVNQVSFEMPLERYGVPKEQWKIMKQNWVLGQEFVPLGVTENAKASGGMVFVGYGISAEELKYDDYAGIDAKGKIVILLSHSPDGETDKGDFYPYSSMRYKISNAIKKGAVGLIMVRIQGDSMNVFERYEYGNIGKNSGLVAIQAHRQSLTKFFPKNVVLLEVEKEINKTRKPKSFDIPNVKCNIEVSLQDLNVATHNIIGYVPGTDKNLENEYIVVGAHFDHLGWGGPSSNYHGKKPLIHNGADDNASGVCGLIELANRISKNPVRRPVIFMGFSAEEMGLLGSDFYTQNPYVDLTKTVAMINMDMIGRMKKDELTIFGVATSPVFPTIIDSLDAIDSLHIIKATDAYGPSDHASFYKKDMPVLMFFTGIHEDYHKPSDDYDKINYEGMANTINFVENTLRTVANNETKPPFTKVVMADNQKPETKGYGKGPWFGIIPSFNESPLGCKISGASPGSPAEKAGMIDGDIIITMNGNKVKNLYDFMYNVKEHKAGDVLDVEILRGEKQEKLLLKVTLVERNK